MGISFGLLDRLRGHGLFPQGGRVLDIGSSNLYNGSPGQILDFISHYNLKQPAAERVAFAERLARGSGYDPQSGGANQAFAGELLEYCKVGYVAFDIADGYRTRIFDLNRQSLDGPYRGAFDTVLNVGTTEHVLNQLNSFEVIHDATQVGGHIVHQLPACGFIDHGYFVYTGRLLFDLAGYNGYEVVDVWYDGPAGEDDLLSPIRSYSAHFPALKRLVDHPPIMVPNLSVTIVCRKTKDAVFNPCLETSTSIGNIPSRVHKSYRHKRGRAVAWPAPLNTAVSRVMRSGMRRLRRWTDWEKRRAPREADATQTAQESAASDAEALLARAESLRGRMAADPAQLNEIYDLYARYAARNVPFPLDVEEHSLRLILDFLRPGDAAAAARLAEVQQMREGPAPAAADTRTN